jgi:hypothetical protein
MLAMASFTVVARTALGWRSTGERVSERDRSGIISGIYGTGVLYLGDYPSTLLGPLPVGLVGAVG